MVVHLVVQTVGLTVDLLVAWKVRHLVDSMAGSLVEQMEYSMVAYLVELKAY